MIDWVASHAFSLIALLCGALGLVLTLTRRKQ